MNYYYAQCTADGWQSSIQTSQSVASTLGIAHMGTAHPSMPSTNYGAYIRVYSYQDLQPPAYSDSLVDAPPAVPGSLDDEFDQSSLDSIRWAWVNQGAATATLTKSNLVLTAPPLAGMSLRVIQQVSPPTPYTVKAKICFSVDWTYISYGLVGLVVSDSITGSFITYAVGITTAGGVGSLQMRIDTWSNATTYSATQVNRPFTLNPLLYFGIQDDGTNLNFLYCIDGITYANLTSWGRTAFLSNGPNRVGLFALSNQAVAPVIMDCDWFRRTQ